MPKMMISYRRADTDVIAGRIHDWLGRQYGPGSVYLDVESIPFGVDFRTHIQQAVTSCDLMIVVIGQQWLGARDHDRPRIHNANDFVRFEIETALEHNVPIIPVLVGTARMPTPQELPESLQRFGFLNAAPMDTGRDFRSHMEGLIRAIDEWFSRIKPSDGKITAFRYRSRIFLLTGTGMLSGALTGLTDPMIHWLYMSIAPPGGPTPADHPTISHFLASFDYYNYYPGFWFGLLYGWVCFRSKMLTLPSFFYAVAVMTFSYSVAHQVVQLWIEYLDTKATWNGYVAYFVAGATGSAIASALFFWRIRISNSGYIVATGAFLGALLPLVLSILPKALQMTFFFVLWQGAFAAIFGFSLLRGPRNRRMALFDIVRDRLRSLLKPLSRPT